MASAQALSEVERRTVAAWAADQLPIAPSGRDPFGVRGATRTHAGLRADDQILKDVEIVSCKKNGVFFTRSAEVSIHFTLPWQLFIAG
jgi:hypothetical protein